MVTPATVNDFPEIIRIWELSVRATHDFLPEDYLQEIKGLLPSILPHVTIYNWINEKGLIWGFAGVEGDKLEMLFIHPDARGRGIGRELTRFCIHSLGIRKVDVNEQNEQALGFYLKMGFSITGRRELDGMGRPFPLIELTFQGNPSN